MRYVPDGVPVANLHLVWSGVWPFLEKAANRFPHLPNKFTEELVLKKLFHKEQQLWICWDMAENRAVGAVTTEIVQDSKHPGKVFLSIALVGGERFNAWGDDLWRLLKAWGVEKGCTHILGSGRRGWIRLYGFVDCGTTDSGLPMFVQTLKR